MFRFLIAFCLALFIAFGNEDLSAQDFKVGQWIPGNPQIRNYPEALSSLIQSLNEKSSTWADPFPHTFRRFSDPKLHLFPLIYVNAGDIPSWDMLPESRDALKNWLLSGGFLFIDSGISASFFEGNTQLSQRHSFANWEVREEIEAFFLDLLPEASFQPIPRSHPIFRSWSPGLPNPENLPEAIRDYVINEKWPNGSYSLMGLYREERLLAVASPILAMGWGRNDLGEWTNPIGFRVRESSETLSQELEQAFYQGETFPVTREDNREEWIFCQQSGTPAWVREPDGVFKAFRYYHSNEISDFAHSFFTQLGINILFHAMDPGP